ncbi:MAG: hypothetical protein MI702_05700 [Chlorobiales bacterium]|nr:hypothetical protein [Chlorobiales bacterium]
MKPGTGKNFTVRLFLFCLNKKLFYIAVNIGPPTIVDSPYQHPSADPHRGVFLFLFCQNKPSIYIKAVLHF